MVLHYFENNEGNTFFVVNEDGKELIEVIIKSYKVNFSKDENGNTIATTFVTIEGNDYEISESVKYLKLYKSVKEYKEGCAIKCSSAELGRYAIVNHLSAKGINVNMRNMENAITGTTYVFNGVMAEEIEFSIDSIEYEWRNYFDIIDITLDYDFADDKTYANPADVYKFNDIMVVKEDGSKELHEGIAKKLMLTDEQKALFEEFKAIVTKISQEPNMLIFLNEDNSTFIAVNKEHTDEFNYGERARDEDQIDARMLEPYQSVKANGFTYFSDGLAISVK